MKWFRKRAHSAFARVAKFALAFIFILTVAAPPAVYAQTPLNLPAPGAMVSLSPAFTPAVIIGVRVHPDNPLMLDFIINKGDSGLEGQALNDEAERLVRYFFAALTIPDDEVWVNLSPYEKDRIVPDSLGQTDMGRDMLAQDYFLKQITASLIYPEESLGKTFWDKIYKKAFELYGTTKVGVDTFNKVWIMPKKNVIYEDGDKAFIIEASLKVMLEEDYLALKKNREAASGSADASQMPNEQKNALASAIVREVIVPELEKEVNAGKNFDQVRQIYHSVVLASWFKNNLKNAALNKAYSNRNKIGGITIDDSEAAQKIYAQYLEAFKKGVCNYIKVEPDPYTNKPIPRKYFSGGLLFGKETAACSTIVNGEQGRKQLDLKVSRGLAGGNIVVAEAGSQVVRGNPPKTKKQLHNANQKIVDGEIEKWKENNPERFIRQNGEPITTYSYNAELQGRFDALPQKEKDLFVLLCGLFEDSLYSQTAIASFVLNLFAKQEVRPEDFDFIAAIKDFNTLNRGDGKDGVWEKLQQYKAEGVITNLSQTRLKDWAGADNDCIKVSFMVKDGTSQGRPAEIFFQNHLYTDKNGEVRATGKRNGLGNVGYDRHTVNLIVGKDRAGNPKVLSLGGRDLCIKVYIQCVANELVLFGMGGKDKSSFTPKAINRLWALLALGLSPHKILEELDKAEYNKEVLVEFFKELLQTDTSSRYYNDFADLRRELKKGDDYFPNLGTFYFYLAMKEYTRLKPGNGLVRALGNEGLGKDSEVVTKRFTKKLYEKGKPGDAKTGDLVTLGQWYSEINKPEVTLKQVEDIGRELSEMKTKYEKYRKEIKNYSFARDKSGNKIEVNDYTDFAVSIAVLTILREYIAPLQENVKKIILEKKGTLTFGVTSSFKETTSVPGEKSAKEGEVLAESSLGTEDVGGIDFNAENLNTEVKGRGIDQSVQEGFLDFDPDSFDGLAPVIINIIPATTMMQILGLSGQDAQTVTGTLSKADGGKKGRAPRYPMGTYA